jgi:hypothetical protein
VNDPNPASRRSADRTVDGVTGKAGRRRRPGKAGKGREDWWAQQDSNLQPRDYESPALTVELWARAGRHWNTLWQPGRPAEPKSRSHRMEGSFQFSVRQRGSGATGEGFNRDSRGDVFGGGGWRGMKPPIQMRGCVSGMVESELRSVDVGPTSRQILGFHLRRSVGSADTTTRGMGVWDFHPQILQMDTDREVERGWRKALVPIRSASRPGQFGDRHSCRWSRTASQTLWIHPGTQSKRRATSTGHRRPAPTPKDNRRNPTRRAPPTPWAPRARSSSDRRNPNLDSRLQPPTLQRVRRNTQPTQIHARRNWVAPNTC